MVYHESMDTPTIRKLIDLDCRFYEEQAESFSQTREKPWDGWQRVLAHVRRAAQPTTPYRILDVGCGNMRFERFLFSEMPQHDLEFTCIDACGQLAGSMHGVRFLERDAIRCLTDGESFIDADNGPFDLVVAFGIAHHVPSFSLRKRFIDALGASCSPQGAVVVSFWQFANDGTKRERALKTTASGLDLLKGDQGESLSLDDGDYLLGWNGLPGVYRYCHSFSDEEIERLLEGYEVREFYRADRANAYAVFGHPRD